MDLPVHIDMEEAATALQPAIHSTYKKLAASRYFTASHLELISSEAKHVINTHANETGAYGYLLYIEGVFSLSRSSSTQDQSFRRFEHFYRSLGEVIKQSLESNKDSHDAFLFMNQMAKRMEKDQRDLFAPWPGLIQQCIPCLSAGHIEKLDEKLKPYTFNEGATHAVLVKSYLSLLAGREKNALQQLMSLTTNWTEQQITPHFRCLEERERWDTILLWLKQLFPLKSDGRYGSLQAFADRSNAQLNKNGAFLSHVWDRWLLAPSFQRYAALTTHESKEKKQQIVDYLLPKLEGQLHHTQTVQVYIRLLHEQQRFDKAAEYFLMYERNPLRLQEDKEALLHDMKVSSPHLVKPVFHQFVVRLAEKKSRAHYEKAAHYVHELMLVYSQENNEERFQHYIQLLKSEYKTYRAFIKELNFIHA
ncbi:hypothetical protein [Alkalicoccobacillus murimartini]|uniref:Uncharacterized protein n=1 Tax=Alkalicoccobacillus murimartini TaxID=171685 RepID=A0ABT9YKC8_9BACI|nr:hypothetical protein [Alkalicoccobacillus murimartini]MDQ0207945.1 hypothetical protein [Alkalicoccobacillus murimartini]